MNSLITSEKVYFKRSIKTHSGKDNKNYLKIYAVFEKLERYDKSEVADRFQGTPLESIRV